MESARNRPLGGTIITSLKKEGKNMKFKDFEEHMTLILDGCDSVGDDIDISVKLERIDIGKRSYQLCKEYFKDEGNNLHRFLTGQLLVFKNPVTDGYMEILIDEGFEALYDFLEFCRLQNSGLLYGDECFEILATLTRISEDQMG